MSFGFSVGDFVAVARLALTLGKALSDTKGASKEYQELIAELNVVHKVLLQVDGLRVANQLAQSTVNALLFTANTANVVMETFLDQHEAYNESLKPGGSGNSMKDFYRKGKWATQMTEKVGHLRRTLGTMLAAMNCLVSLACYHNTGFDARCSVTFRSNVDGASNSNYRDPRCPWNDLKVEAALKLQRLQPRILSLGFSACTDPFSFFRPGQVFAVQIVSSLYLGNGRKFREVDFGHLPLEPISKLAATAEMERLEDRTKRLAQIRSLPLEKMSRYCSNIPMDRENILCLLCTDRRYNPNPSYPRDEWASGHFRLNHWKQYFGMISNEHCLQLDRKGYKVIPWEIQHRDLPATNSQVSADDWITLDDVTSDNPIRTDDQIANYVMTTTEQHRFSTGPIMIQRFVVVREGISSCLCLGIRTFARRGCGNEPDRELFGVISSEKVPPPLQPNETGIVLSAIRMKSDHPSTALPSTARIHFQRTYEIDHGLPIQPLGLIHPASMETLLDQFESNVIQLNEDENSNNSYYKSYEESCKEQDAGIRTADMHIVKEMRENISSVLGNRLSPTEYI